MPHGVVHSPGHTGHLSSRNQAGRSGATRSTHLPGVLCVAALIAGLAAAAPPASATVQYDSQWGQLGDESFQGPRSLATDTLGNVYVTDTYNNRISKWDSSGNFALIWGSNGTGEGQFGNPTDVATDSLNNVYVADTLRHRIQKFNSAGIFERMWGWGVDTGAAAFEVCTSGCQSGTNAGGGAAGSFNYPQGIDTDSSGNVYVADTDNHRIQVFDSNGNFDRTWGWGVDTGASALEVCTTSTLPCFGGYFGSGDGQLRVPYGVATDSTGDVYVADTNNHRIQKFSSSGGYLTKWGMSGTAEGQFFYPGGVETDSAGFVYVADTSRHRIQKFNPSSMSHSFNSMWGWGVDTGATAFEVCTSACQGGWNFSYGDGGFSAPEDVATDSSGNVYVADVGHDWIQKFNSTPAFVTKWGVQTGSGPGEIAQRAWDVATDSSGYVYVSDLDNARVQKFDSVGNFITMWGGESYGTAEGEFYSPDGIAIDSLGYVYVADVDLHRVQKFNSSGVFQRMWGWGVQNGADAFQICTSGCEGGVNGTGDGQFNYPQGGIAIDSNDKVYVGDAGNGRIQRFDTDGNFEAKWGEYGDLENQFCYPLGIAVDSSDRVYVSDDCNDRIQRFSSASSSNTFQRMWGWGVRDGTNAFQICTSGCQYGLSGWDDGQLNDPEDIAIDSSDHLYVADYWNNRIQKFDSDGGFIRTWGFGVDDGTNVFQDCTSGCQYGQQGSGDGEFYNPIGVAIDAAFNVYVSDDDNNRIQKFSQTFDNSFSGSVVAGGTASTNATAEGDDPVGTSVTTPNAAAVTIDEQSPPTQSPPSTYTFFDWEIDLSVSPGASTTTPLTLEFRIDDLLLPNGIDETNVEIFKNGTLVPACSGPPGEASPDPCVSNRAAAGGGDVEITVLSSTASDWNIGAADTGTLVIRKDTVPDDPRDFTFTAGGGLAPTSFTLDDDADGTLSNTQTFLGVPGGSGYSVSETVPSGWEQSSATCDDGSPLSNISISAFETVTCTIVNSQIAYARPQAATPSSIRLVPAFYSCFSPDSTHGAPLDEPSCSSVTQASSYLTMNAPDRPAPYNTTANGSASIVLKVTCHTPGTTTETGQTPPCPAVGDQIDVRITSSLTGIRCVGVSGGCVAAAGTYEGELLGYLPLRLTDRLNGTVENKAGTLEDYPFTWGLQCTGGACSSTTSLDAVIPGIAREGKRTVVELDQVMVLDGGADGDVVPTAAPPGSGTCPPSCEGNDGENLFLQQGLFIP